jgi:hypothetical protein
VFKLAGLNSPVKFFFSIHSEEWSSLVFFDLCIDDHGSLVICRVSFSPTQTSLRS